MSNLNFWWDLPSEESADAIFATVAEIEEEQSSLRSRWRDYAQLYSNRQEMGLNWTLGSALDAYEALVTENVVKSVIDTAASIIAKNRVKVRVLTNGAVWSLQRKARKLEKFVYAEMKARGAWELGPLIFRDACVFGTGAAKVFHENGKICLKRVLIDNIIVDERQAITGEPRELHERCLVDKDVLISKYKQYQDEIELAVKRDAWAEREIPNNQVVVIESWRLPSKPGASDGKHTICVENAVLFSETYKKDCFPFVFLRWDGKPLTGFYGLGLARDLAGFQTRINQLNNFFQKAQDLIAVPRVFVDVASKLLKIQIDNKIGAIIPYRGKPPTFFTPQAINAEMYNYKEQLVQSAFKFAGISQLSAQSLKPAGLESAVALREYSDIETSRFSIQAQRYETFFMDLGEKIIDVAKDLYSAKTDLKTRFKDRTVLQEIKWSDVNIEADHYDLDIQPASLLSMSPSARLQAVTELAQVGQLSREEIRYLLQHPDLERSNSIAYADFEDIQRVEETLLDGRYEPPESFQNLELGLKRIQLLYLKTKADGAEDDAEGEEILENMRTWIAQAKAELDMMAAETAQTGVPMQPGAPTAEPPIGAAGVAGSGVVGNLPMPITAGG